MESARNRSAIGLSGSGIAGQVLHLENNEGNGKTSMSLGAGADQLDSEIAWFDATDALRLTNRSSVAGSSSVRIAVGGETSDKVIVTTTGMGVGATLPSVITSTMQVEGSFALQANSPGGSTTLDNTKCVQTYLGASNATFTLPVASTCEDRIYIIMNHSFSGVITLTQTVFSGNGSSFTTINPGQYSIIHSVPGNGWRGMRITSE